MHRSQTVFTSRLPFRHPGRWHASQLVTAWLTHGEGLGQRIMPEIQFCATSNVREDLSDAASITAETAGGDPGGGGKVSGRSREM